MDQMWSATFGPRNLAVRFGGRGKAYLCPYPYRPSKEPSRRVELVLKWPNLVPDRIGSSKRGNIIDTIRRFLLNLAILAFSLPEIDLRQPLYLVVSKSMNNFSLGRSSISKKGILGTDPNYIQVHPGISTKAYSL